MSVIDKTDTNLKASDSRARHLSLRLPLLIFCLLALLITAYSFYRFRFVTPSLPVTGDVTRGDLETSIAATGKIEPHAYVDVGAQASGQLTRIRVHIGDIVRQGDLLAEIDPQVQAAKVEADQAQLAQFEANLAEQQANIVYAEATFKRYGHLIPSDSVSRLTYDQGERDAKAALAKAEAIRAQIRQMQSTLKADQVTLGYTKIFAPMSGTIVSIDAREGQTVNAAYSTPQILRIADLTTMTISAEVSEADIVQIHQGMPVYFTTLGHGARRWISTVGQILPAPQKPPSTQAKPDAATQGGTQAANNVVLYTVLFDIDNREGDLRPEMTALISFITASAKEAIVVPTKALHPAGTDGIAVTLLTEDGEEREQMVRTGLRTRLQTEILSGLHPGDRVVIGRQASASHGTLMGFSL